MYGTPITFCPKITESNQGYVVVVGLNELLAEEVKTLNILKDPASYPNEDQYSFQEVSETQLTVLLEYPNVDTAPLIAWNMSGNLFYIYLNKTTFPYSNKISFFLIGTRVGIPVTSMDSLIDVPEKDMELFIKYVLREAAQLKGKPVPASIEMDIKELENKFRG